ncbi:MAG: FAD-binding protein [Gammaproteobacteria bacterium]|nr:FAD-binding protein [Gammaproteobacteria bacterium]MYD76991.1 FAD-binding protein [Gammaproteobacteria bacterium]MYJ52285.1 FAD-binding protein [Gammaproteobacteria bacterium]
METGKLEKIFLKALPRRCLVSDRVALRTYECDGLSAYRQPPGLVVLPENTEQVMAALKICRENAIPVVGRGGGTGLSGGALPHPDGIVLSLSKMNRMLEIDPENRIARVQPGVTNLSISKAVEHLGLYYAPDPSSQIACTIGGNIAENAGGVHCLKYGLTVHNVIALKVATIEGDLLEIGDESMTAPGFNLLSLMVGSEGMMGIVVEATVKLLPVPECARVVMGIFESVQDAGDSVAAVIASGIIPAGIEMMDNPAIRAAEAFVNAGYPVDARAILLCELDGIREEVDQQIQAVDRLFRENRATDIRIARDDHERQLFWSGRKAAFPAVGRLSPDYYCIDGTIPRQALGKVLTEIERLSDEYGLRVANVFHAGDGNLHPLILYDAREPGQLEKTIELGSRILNLCIGVGGTITGEHGVGVEKIGEMCTQFTDDERELFHAVRKCLDPQSLLNPGKAIPTLARCAEHGAMHVHEGQLPFPDIERF